MVVGRGAESVPGVLAATATLEVCEVDSTSAASATSAAASRVLAHTHADVCGCRNTVVVDRSGAGGGARVVSRCGNVAVEWSLAACDCTVARSAPTDASVTH